MRAWPGSIPIGVHTYPPTERMAILELRAARGWTLEPTASTFLVTGATIAAWMKRLDEAGPDALVQLREPVNKFPDFVRDAVQRLKTLCPSLGKVKLAQVLWRAGLHLGVTTVGRILKEPPCPKEKVVTPAKGRVVTAREPGHVWHIDLTAVPRPRFLDHLVAVCNTAAVAVLLVVCSRDRPLFAPDHEDQDLRRQARLPRRVRYVGVDGAPGRRRAQIHRLRPRQHLRLRRVSTLGET
jgi:hypothetical protein